MSQLKKEISLPLVSLFISVVISCNISPVDLFIKTDLNNFDPLIKLLVLSYRFLKLEYHK